MLDSFEENEFKYTPEPGLPDVTGYSRQSAPLSPAVSNTTRSIVAG